MKLRFFALLFSAGLITARLAAITIEELAANAGMWPAEVSTLGSIRATIIKDGKPAGAMLVGAGKKLTVLNIAPAGITGKMGSTTVLVPVDKTNLWTEVARLQPDEARAVPAVEATSAAPPPTVKPAPASPTAKPAPAPTSGKVLTAPSAMQRRLAGKIVRLENKTLKPVDAASLAGVKYYGLYYSASWCGPCRQFTPSFVEAYRQIKQLHPEFEVVFVSADRSAGAMADYMKEDRMPWLAVKYDAAQSDAELRRYCGPGIPCLVLVDSQGRVLSDSFEGDNYVGPRKVLADAQRLLAAAR